jgi:protein-disulfide isomerase
MRPFVIAVTVAAGLCLGGPAMAETVATVDGTPITREQLEAAIKPQLIEIDNQRYEALSEGLDGMIAEQLVEKEAKARGVTPEALLETEVTSKVPAPSDEEIQKIYDANKAQLGNQTLDQVKERIVQYMKGQQEAELQGEFIEGLRQKYKVTVALEPPKVVVSDGGAPSRGPANAPITIIEFSDYECPFCKKAEPTVKQVMEAYPDKVRLVYRHYPLPFHQNARPAAIASACANLQGKFWEYHEKVFAAPSLTADSLKKVAGEVGLDQAKFDACLDNGETASVVDKDVEDASAVGVRGTPAFFVNGRMLSGAQPFERFKTIIDEELARSSGS